MQSQLRIARPTDNLDLIVEMYRNGLGLSALVSFKDHQGFDGVMLGKNGLQYHFEFTHHHGHVAGKAPTQDNLLVFYMPDWAEWEMACIKMEAAGFRSVPSYNPYWDQDGRTFEDMDGYRVVLENSGWK